MKFIPPGPRFKLMIYNVSRDLGIGILSGLVLTYFISLKKYDAVWNVPSQIWKEYLSIIILSFLLILWGEWKKLEQEKLIKGAKHY